MNYYNILGLTPTATPDEIKKAYRKLAMVHHPDRGGDPKKFQEISEAYEALKNPTTSRGPFQSANSQNFREFDDLNDLFNHVFRGQFNQSANRTQIMRTTVAVTLQDAYYGAEKPIQIRTVKENKLISIKVLPGIKTGDQVRYDNVIENTILVVEFYVTEDLKFARNGNDLHCNLPVSVLDLIVGGKVEFTTFDNKKIEVEIPAGTQPNRDMRVTGKGMPVYGHTNAFGDQILHLKPFVPKDLPDTVINAIKEHTSNNKEN
jgi:DnaJ-class molecular chaperone